MSPSSTPFWPKGVPRTLSLPQVPLTHYVQVAAERYPNKPAVIFCGSTLTYAALLTRVEALAGYLTQRLGVQRGDRVLLMSQNCPQYVAAYYGIMRAGAVVVPVNAMCTQSEIRYYLQDSGARVAVVAQELLPQVMPLLQPGEGDALQAVLVHAYSEGLPAQPASNEVPEVVLAPRQWTEAPGLHGLEDAIAQALPAPAQHPGSHDLCVLPYTSGTTGHPKGCMHTHATVLASNMAAQVWRSMHMDSVFLAVAPLFHMLGMQGGLNVPITLGATVVMLPRWHAASAARLIEQHRVTTWSAPPAMLIDFFANPAAAQRDLSSLSALAGGGAAMPETVANLLQTRFGIAYNEAYGMTETASFLLGNPPARGKRQCLGVITPGVDARIVDPETLRELPVGEVGELVTRGPQLMRGYWQNEQANQSSFFELDGQTFFRTGDLASVDEEGYFFMRDRLKRMVNVSGFKVWPAEVENTLYEHPAVHEACVISVPDTQRGENVMALLVLKPDAKGQVTEQDIIDWSREHMAVYKAPRIVRFMDVLPKSGTGKILWRQLQEQEHARLNTTSVKETP
ncbi:long-chain-fatty-acid--CoA ligase [Limnohabitans sp. 63ED37-2]|uniref:long-chain-fatty-acid--CoA ligase n=1 Tax=Limnohabitans sp. 63ED37-2 TaxID=1678128 RepID=UPI0007058D60|nr:long-chain-fatty-acid--CoA ligase [Limnohabitans sp. 63ED37-2]ALK90169.1 Long-chain-fatty-acid--CoA ligase [Limnohabitans sp. 63ED37-2]